MCRTTRGSQAASALADVRKLPALASALQPFATKPYPTIGTQDDTFQKALNDATAAAVAAGNFGANPRVAFSLIALATDGNHRHAGVFETEMNFSASLVKVAAMFAAHELLAAARRLARRKGFADKPAFFAALSSTFDPAITAVAVKEIRDVVIDDPPGLMGHAPRYSQIFEPANLGTANEPSVEFSEQFQKDLVSMIGFGTNEGASQCIRKLSYRYINAALIKGGFYTPGSPPATPANGIWLAGDYLGDKNKRNFNDNAHIRYVRTDCTNDCGVENGVTNCKVAQIATARRMANMFALIELGMLPADDTKTGEVEGRTVPDSNAKMQKLLSEPKPVNPATGEHDIPWLDQSRLRTVTLQFTATKDKVGFADLKRGPNVYSEGLIIEWTRGAGDAARLAARNLSGRIAVCWQNLVGPPRGKSFKGIVQVINQAFSTFIATPP